MKVLSTRRYDTGDMSISSILEFFACNSMTMFFAWTDIAFNLALTTRDGSFLISHVYFRCTANLFVYSHQQNISLLITKHCPHFMISNPRNPSYPARMCYISLIRLRRPIILFESGLAYNSNKL